MERAGREAVGDRSTERVRARLCTRGPSPGRCGREVVGSRFAQIVTGNVGGDWGGIGLFCGMRTIIPLPRRVDEPS